MDAELVRKTNYTIDELQLHLSKISPGVISELDRKFWYIPSLMVDGQLFEEYSVFPFGSHVNLPYRQCHQSSIDICIAGKEKGIPLVLCTGYAKCEEDPFWVLHSWVVHEEDKTLLEPTPIVRNYYYGIKMEGFEL